MQHFSVDEVVFEMQDRGEKIGRSTVYRFLELLSEQGSVRKYQNVKMTHTTTSIAICMKNRKPSENARRPPLVSVKRQRISLQFSIQNRINSRYSNAQMIYLTASDLPIFRFSFLAATPPVPFVLTSSRLIDRWCTRCPRLF